MNRRGFVKHAGVTAATLATFGAHRALAASPDRRRGGYGDVRPVPDRDGRTVLALPAGFEYVTFSRTGEAFGDGLKVPRSHDGMTCVQGAGGTLRLVRNHEMRNAAGDFTLGVNGPAHLRYDVKAMGGCMALDFDPDSMRLVRQFVAIGGTYVNCAGGLSYRDGGWLTCEEVPVGPKQGFDKPHGYVFHVPAAAATTVAAVPLKPMGRFAHEAAVAAASGFVYETEDAGNTSGFYRYIPRSATDLTAGRLQMLAVKGSPGAALYTGERVGERLPVEWVDVANPDPDLENGAPRCFDQAFARGGAAFNRLEGIFRGADGESIYFVSTSGGSARSANGVGYGQLWQYTPAGRGRRGDELTLVFESPAASVLESPDNLCITPRGGILFCEDDAVGDGDTHPLAGGHTDIDRLVGLAPSGETFTFAVNVLNATELAGACFSPDGRILFVNVFGDSTPGSGMTCAIRGPWEKGPL